MSTNKLKLTKVESLKDTYMVEIETDIGDYKSTKQMFFEPKEFVNFFKPIIDTYMILDSEEFYNGNNTSGAK